MFRSQNYTINYKAYNGDTLIKEGTYNVKNKLSELSAKISLEAYLKKKIPNITHIHMTIPLNTDTMFGGIFKGIFK